MSNQLLQKMFRGKLCRIKVFRSHLGKSWQNAQTVAYSYTYEHEKF